MEFQSTLTSWLQLQPNTTELLSDGSISDVDVNDYKYLIHCFRVAFTVLGIAIGISGIGFNTALMISSVITTSSPTTLSFQSRNLIASLAAADLFLLVFGLPYDLVAANNYPWLEGRFGCQMSAYLSEASRFVWVGTAVISLPDHWPSLMKMRQFALAWTGLIWAISLAIAVPFAVNVDCLPHTSLDYTPTVAEMMESSDACLCMLTVSQPEVVRMFGSSLVAFSLIPAMAIGRICFKSCSTDDQSSDLKRNTSTRTIGVMLLAFMACTLPRYIYMVVNYSEMHLTVNDDYELVMSAIEIVCCCLFYISTLIHLVVSPNPRSLLCRQPSWQLRHRQSGFSL